MPCDICIGDEARRQRVFSPNYARQSSENLDSYRTAKDTGEITDLHLNAVYRSVVCSYQRASSGSILPVRSVLTQRMVTATLIVCQMVATSTSPPHCRNKNMANKKNYPVLNLSLASRFKSFLSSAKFTATMMNSPHRTSYVGECALAVSLGQRFHSEPMRQDSSLSSHVSWLRFTCALPATKAVVGQAILIFIDCTSSSYAWYG